MKTMVGTNSKASSTVILPISDAFRGGLGGVRMGQISNLPIYVAIAPEDPFLVMYIVLHVSTNRGPRR